MQLGTRHTCCVYRVYSGEIRGYNEGKQWHFLLRHFLKFCWSFVDFCYFYQEKTPRSEQSFITKVFLLVVLFQLMIETVYSESFYFLFWPLILSSQFPTRSHLHYHKTRLAKPHTYCMRTKWRTWIPDCSKYSVSLNVLIACKRNWQTVRHQSVSKKEKWRK